MIDQTQGANDGAAPKSAPPAPAGAPEAYTDFTAPEGRSLDPAVITEASSIFRELGLDQTQAQRLVDFYAKHEGAQQSRLTELIEQTRTEWRDAIKADPEIGPKLDSVKTEVGRALDKLGDAKLVADVRAGLDLTGAGDHPAIVKAFYKLAQMVNEGQHVSGGSPSPEGQARPGTSTRPSLAAAMYPNLNHG